MDLGDFNIKNDLFEKNNLCKRINEFAKELSNFLQKMNNINDVHTSQLEEGKLYVISDIRNNEINVVDIDNGNEIKVYISTNNKI